MLYKMERPSPLITQKQATRVKCEIDGRDSRGCVSLLRSWNSRAEAVGMGIFPSLGCGWRRDSERPGVRQLPQGQGLPVVR